jgi:hypothetical protein
LVLINTIPAPHASAKPRITRMRQQSTISWAATIPSCAVEYARATTDGEGSLLMLTVRLEQLTI